MATRRLLLRAGAGAALALTAGAAAPAVASAAPAAHPRRKALQDALDAVTASGASAVLAELRDEAGVWRGTSGVAELGTRRPVPVNGQFRVGSVTKTFVAAVVLQLAHERRLGLDDPVERWLPGLLPDGRRITLRHLLQHTSGIYNYTDDLFTSVERMLRDRWRTYRARDLVAMATERPPLFEPGEDWSYSNTNYLVLGLVIERVTRRPYGAEVARRVLGPLGLRHTTVPGVDPLIHGPHAHGYLPVEHNGRIHPVDITAYNPSVAGAAGEIISTTAELNRFYRALFTGGLLPPALLDEMTDRPTGPMGYALGVFRVPLPCGRVLWGHTGGFPGYSTYAFTTDDGRAQMTISVNPYPEADPAEPLDNLVLAGLCGQPSVATRAAVSRIPLLR